MDKEKWIKHPSSKFWIWQQVTHNFSLPTILYSQPYPPNSPFLQLILPTLLYSQLYPPNSPLFSTLFAQLSFILNFILPTLQRRFIIYQSMQSRFYIQKSPGKKKDGGNRIGIKVQVNLRAPRMVEQDKLEVVVDVGALVRHEAEAVALLHHLLWVSTLHRVSGHWEVVYQPTEWNRKKHYSWLTKILTFITVCKKL